MIYNSSFRLLAKCITDILEERHIGSHTLILNIHIQWLDTKHERKTICKSTDIYLRGSLCEYREMPPSVFVKLMM